MVCSYYNTVGKMEDCFSEGRGFDPESGTLLFVERKSSIQRLSAFCSGFSCSVESFYVAMCFKKKNANPI